jgi:hypothetical protein
VRLRPLTERLELDYLRLGLRLGRHVEGIVDAYFGPPELVAAVEAEPPAAPPALVDAADTLLAALEDGWLRDQVAGLRTYAAALAGESLSYADEVEGCYGVRPTYTDEAVFTAAHERLARLLPGEGAPAERYERWQAATRVPTAQVEPTVAAVIAKARELTRAGVIDLPDGEGVELETVRDVPWLGYCEYLGELRSRISVNVDQPMSAIELLVLALHETYPGHHVERASKDHRLVGGRGLLEETLVLVPTPQSLVTEGIATLAPQVLLEGEGGPALAAIVRDAGIDFDLAQALAVEHAIEPLRWVEVNAALMLHDDGASETEAHAYLRQWGLMSSELATHLIRFLGEPTSRTYIVTYPAGRDLCRAFVAGEPARFRRLLTEQVRIGELREARTAGSPGPTG